MLKPTSKERQGGWIIPRQVPNLSRTMWMMEGYGLVELKKSVREIEPVALATRFKIQIG